MTQPTMRAGITSKEYLRIAGGLGAAAAGESPAGGLDVDNAGNLATGGDVTVKGTLDAQGGIENTTGVAVEIPNAVALAGATETAANIYGDELVIGTLADGRSGISLLSDSDSGWSTIFFGDPSLNIAGRVQYDHGNDKMNLGTNGRISDFAIDSDGNACIGGFLNLGTPTELTIASGVVAATRSYHVLDTEANAATDDLDTINGGSAGDVLILHSADAARDVTLKDGAGNLLLAGDFTLASRSDSITLIKRNSSEWFELARSTNS